MTTRSPEIGTTRTFFALCNDTRIEGLAEVTTLFKDHEDYTKKLSWAILTDTTRPIVPNTPELKIFLLKKIRNMKLEIYFFSLNKEEEYILNDIDQDRLFNIIKTTGVNIYD